MKQKNTTTQSGQGYAPMFGTHVKLRDSEIVENLGFSPSKQTVDIKHKNGSTETVAVNQVSRLNDDEMIEVERESRKSIKTGHTIQN